MHVGTAGLSSQDWPSLSSTLSFVREALGEGDLVLSPLERGEPLPKNLDVVLNFSGNVGWDLLAGHREFPIAFFAHGGCMLNRGFIRRHLHHFRPGDTFIVQSSADEDVLAAMVDNPRPFVRRLALPVDTELFTPVGRASARGELKLDDDVFCVGIVSRLLPQKNIHGAIEVFAELVKRNPGKRFRLVILGTFWKSYRILRFDETPYAQVLRETIERLGVMPLVTYIPADLSRQEVARAYRAFDVLLHTTNSIDENYGWAPVEAMASGVPVVGCAYGGLKDTVVDGRTGYLAATWLSLAGIREDRSELLRGLTTLLHDPKTRERFANEGRQRVIEQFSPAPCKQQLRGILRDARDAWVDSEDPSAMLVREEPDLARYDRHLTAAHDRVSDYAGSLLHYVSRPVPTASDRAYLRRVEHLVYDRSSGIGRLANPAWPAVYELQPDQCDALADCTDAVDGRALVERHGEALVDRLLELGLLVPQRYPQVADLPT